MQDLVPIGNKWQIDHFVDHVAKMSNGRLIIQPFMADELVPTEEMHIAVQQGTIEMSRDAGAYCSDIVDIANVEFGLPRAWDGPMAMWTIFIRLGMLELCREAYAEQGIYFASVTAEPPYAMIAAEPIPNLEAIQGMKMRAYGLTASWLDSVGAKTTYVSAPEIYTAFATGTIDACVYGGARDYLGMSFGEVTKYYLYDPYMVNPNTDSILVNMDAWNSLPEDLQDILEVASWERNFWCETDFYLGEYTAVEEMGIEGVYWPAEDIKILDEAALPFWDEEAAKSPRCAEAIQIMKDWQAMQ